MVLYLLYRALRLEQSSIIEPLFITGALPKHIVTLVIDSIAQVSLWISMTIELVLVY
jgi:hypothetical protein